jgi:hypothetical protein
VLQEDVMSPTLSEKCQFHVIPSPSSLSSSTTATATTGPTVHCEPTKIEEQEDMETEAREGQLSVTINVHVGEYHSHLYPQHILYLPHFPIRNLVLVMHKISYRVYTESFHAWMSVYFGVGSKRRHSDDSFQDGSSLRFGEVPKSEVWSLRDVIFTDHVTNVKVGSVVKLDGNYVAVHYPALSADELSTANLDNCRLLRKDELVVHI